MTFFNMEIVGYWDAAANQPELVSGKGIRGTMYQVNVAGSTDIDGINLWEVGDLIYYGRDSWGKINRGFTALPTPEPGEGQTVVVIFASEYGAVGDGVTNDRAAIQAAIDAANLSGGHGIVELGEGTFLIGGGSLLLKTGVILRGNGWNKTVLKMQSGMTDYCVKQVNDNVEMAGVERLKIDGFAVASATPGAGGIKFTDAGFSGSNSDPHNFIRDVLMEGVPGPGVYADSREARYENVVCRGERSNMVCGFDVAGTDQFFSNCTAASYDATSGVGFKVDATNNHFSQCKAFYCASHGWEFGSSGHKTTMIGCSAQENNGDGLHLHGSLQNCTITSFMADSNLASGIHLNGAVRGCVIEGVCFGTSGLRNPIPQAGLKVTGVPVANSITVSSIGAANGGVATDFVGDLDATLNMYQLSTRTSAVSGLGVDGVRSGRFTIGSLVPYAVAGGVIPLAQMHSNFAEGGFSSTRWAGSNAAPQWHLNKSRGTSVGTRGVVQNADTLGLLIFSGDDGTNFIPAAQVSAAAEGAPAANDMPGRLVFSTTASGASSVTERARITSAGQVLVGHTAPFGFGSVIPRVQNHGNDSSRGSMGTFRWSNDNNGPYLLMGKSKGANPGTRGAVTDGTVLGYLGWLGDDGTDFNGGALIYAIVDGTPGSADLPTSLVFATTNDNASSPTEAMRISPNGSVRVHSTVNVGSQNAVEGFTMQLNSSFQAANDAAAIVANRIINDGVVIQIQGQGTTEGTIDVNGATVTYTAFCGAHWSQLIDKSSPEILPGTLVESLDEMCEWDGEVNRHLPKFKVSETPGSKCIYGVFKNWGTIEEDGDWRADANIASIGAWLIRIGAGVTVQRGDYLESNGDGTARVQADDILRSSTVAKVTSTHVTETYPDGSYLVPCTLHCG